MKPIYLIINAATIIFPLVRSFEPKIKYAKKWYALFPAILVTATIFIIWDVIFTKNGVWGFNKDYLVDVELFNLPIEEWLFFITVPFASVFIYECVRYYLPKIRTSGSLRTLSTAFSLILILVATYNWEQSYTFWCFCFTGIYLTIISYQNPKWLGKFWIAYLIHLIPFVIVNGILTGSYLEEPIVWYNNDHNLGIRIFTIPIEDTIYALLLLLMNVSFFEYFRKTFLQTKRKKQSY